MIPLHIEYLEKIKFIKYKKNDNIIDSTRFPGCRNQKSKSTIKINLNDLKIAFGIALLSF